MIKKLLKLKGFSIWITAQMNLRAPQVKSRMIAVMYSHLVLILTFLHLVLDCTVIMRKGAPLTV